METPQRNLRRFPMSDEQVALSLISRVFSGNFRVDLLRHNVVIGVKNNRSLFSPPRPSGYGQPGNQGGPGLAVSGEILQSIVPGRTGVLLFLCLSYVDRIQPVPTAFCC